MRNIKLTIEYDGANYSGWQRQNSRRSPVTGHRSKTIQETIEKTLQKILQEKIRLIGSGRTDAGVHAEGQTANFKTKSDIPLDRLQRALNGLLPDDIVITKTEKVRLGFHSRFDAKSKVYGYTILNRAYPSAILRSKVYFYRFPLNIELMQNEAKVLLGKHNFKSFQSSGSREANPVRSIKKLKITKERDFIRIGIEANGFLYNMARNIAGTLIEIGRGRFKKGALKMILQACDRRRAGPTAPACGLCLLKVKY